MNVQTLFGQINKTKEMKKSSTYLIITLAVFVIGYIFLKTAYYKTENLPFLNEIVLLFIGTIATIAITAALINKQSEIELEKEQRVKIFEIKSSLYFELIDFLEKVILKKEITKTDLINLEFLTHKISIIANKEVLSEYVKFIKTIKEISKDTNVSPSETIELSIRLNSLCSKIRYDILIKEEEEEFKFEKLLNE